ncbi:MAG: preprotein translocase subunit SecY [Deltaproteobacteria bacterium]|nr:preprotein translocase subunit SecY [Deltaproteobacteria bacterium]
MAGVQGITKIPELRRRIFFTFFILALVRLGTYIPLPGINAEVLQEYFRADTIFGFFNLISGNALSQMSILALGIMPYISASIIFDLLKVVWPYLKELSQEGEEGRKKITQYTRYGTVALSLFQGMMLASLISRAPAQGGQSAVMHPGFEFILMTMVTLSTGTMLLVWLGEQITSRGIGNGISLIIFAGIAARIVPNFKQLFSYVGSTTSSLNMIDVFFILGFIVLVIAFIVFMERGQRRVPIQYAKRIQGRRMYGGQSTHLPLKINTSGVIPPIFASSILTFPNSILQFFTVGFLAMFASVMNDPVVFNVVYVGLIIFFCYFYTSIVFNPQEVSDNLKKYGGYIPGIRPGSMTADYLEQLLNRITFGGALYISAVCVIPTLFYSAIGSEVAFMGYAFGGTSVIILIGVALDTVAQVESHLLSRHYEGFMKQAKMRGRR